MGSGLVELITRERKFLTEKKSHTTHKILYICAYVREWLHVLCNTDNTNLNFIDCMSNAGVYTDGDLCTAVEVLKIFVETAKDYPDKIFNVLFNDYNADSIRISKDVCAIVMEQLPPNVHVHFDQLDVNLYLQTLKTKYDIFGFYSKTILYVDPYDFRTVHLPVLRDLLQNTYCELIYNFFTSDAVRNGIDSGIAKALGGQYTFKNTDELINFVVKLLTVGAMKYHLSYTFRNSKNVELYQILFITPHAKGLDKLKQAIWDTFNGQEYYRTDITHVGQLSLFSEQDDREYWAKTHASEAMNILKAKYIGKIIAYDEIEKAILPQSLLMSSQIINYLIKPNIASGNIVKQNKVNTKSNYKNDSYLIK